MHEYNNANLPLTSYGLSVVPSGTFYDLHFNAWFNIFQIFDAILFVSRVGKGDKIIMHIDSVQYRGKVKYVKMNLWKKHIGLILGLSEMPMIIQEG